MEAATEISFVSLLPMQYQMEASFVEIYNETLRDLLATSTSDGDTKHEIKMDPNRPGEVYVTNLTPTQVTSEEQVSGKPPSRTNHSVQECYERALLLSEASFCALLQVTRLLERAARNRAVAATQCNERSSRSHSVFRLKLTGKNAKTGEACDGKDVILLPLTLILRNLPRFAK